MRRPDDASATDGVRVSSAMVALAWTVLHGTAEQARDAGRALADLVLKDRP
jgi:hypothetical protein